MRLRLTLLAVTIVVALMVASRAVVAIPQTPAAKGHDERVAANTAEKFSWALSVHPAVAYELLDASARMPPQDFMLSVSRMLPSGPTPLEATHVATAGQALDIFLTGRSASDRGHFLFRMVGSAARGYRVLSFARLTTGPDASTRPLAPDTGPFRAYLPLAANSQVALVPIAADASLVSSLADTFAARLQLDTKLQAVYVPSPRARSAERGQLIGEVLAKELEPRCRRGMTGTPFVIGVTGEDMYLQSNPRWQFAFSYRMAPCVAVVSYARMHLGASLEVRTARLRKMVAKNLGVLVYGLPLAKDPRSLMFDQILGIEDLDFIEENFARAGMAPAQGR